MAAAKVLLAQAWPMARTAAGVPISARCGERDLKREIRPSRMRGVAVAHTRPLEHRVERARQLPTRIGRGRGHRGRKMVACR
jgi:hypothetical protein